MHRHHREQVAFAIDAVRVGALATCIEHLARVGATVHIGPPSRQGWLVEVRIEGLGAPVSDTSDSALLSIDRCLRQLLRRTSSVVPPSPEAA